MYGQPDFYYISSVISSPYKLRCALPRCPGGSCRRTSSRFHGSWPVRNNRAYRLREPWCLSQSRHGRDLPVRPHRGPRSHERQFPGSTQANLGFPLPKHSKIRSAAFNTGVKWKEKEMIDKACKWVKLNINNVSDTRIEDLRKELKG